MNEQAIKDRLEELHTKFVTWQCVADVLGVHPGTLKQWRRTGRIGEAMLGCWYVSPPDHRLFSLVTAQVAAAKAERKEQTKRERMERRKRTGKGCPVCGLQCSLWVRLKPLRFDDREAVVREYHA